MSTRIPLTYYLQDTLPVPRTDSPAENPDVTDTAAEPGLLKHEPANRFFTTPEQKEKEPDSISRVQTTRPLLRVSEKPAGIDAAGIPDHLKSDGEMYPGNPPGPSHNQSFTGKDHSSTVFIETAPAPSINQTTKIIYSLIDKPSSYSHELRPDWLLVLILIILIGIAWLKLFYHKFFNQTLKSLFNFQRSAKMLRDENIFSRRVAFLLNLNFVLTGGALIYLIFGLFNLRPFPWPDWVCYLAYSGTIAALLILRFIASRLTGFLFLKQAEFREYLFQILLIHKNLGIYFIPLIIGIAYVHEDLRIFFVYLAGIILITSLILRIIRGFQILLHKDFLIFYLILYLCTLEILPVLIFYRLFSLTVMMG